MNSLGALELSMRWQLYQGDILDVPADILVCSANVYLTMSGGVGGAFLLRYGPAMQHALQHFLVERGVRHVERGDIVRMPPCGSPYRAVLHAVAVDGFYESSQEIVADVIARSLRQAVDLEARSVALTAVATGYGRLSMLDFAAGFRRIIEEPFLPIERVIIGIRSPYEAEELFALAPELEKAEWAPMP